MKLDLPEALRPFIALIEVDSLGRLKPEVSMTLEPEGWWRVRLTFALPITVAQDDWQVRITPAFAPEFHWAPHLTPTDDHVADQHVFRSPALIMQDRHQRIVLIPDLKLLRENALARCYLDNDAARNRMVLGMSRTCPNDHVLFVRESGATYEKGEVTAGFFIKASHGFSAVDNPFRETCAFFWQRFGATLHARGEPLAGTGLAPFVEHAYHWALGDSGWSRHVWQEFEIDGRHVGGTNFIVNVSQSPNFTGEYYERERRSIWNQAWFSALRSASGIFRHGRRIANQELMRKARLSKELALAMPQQDGLFFSVVATEMERLEVAGQTVLRARGWETHYFTNSNRCPPCWRAGQVALTREQGQGAPFHILDMSWTASLMLMWYEELEEDPRLLAYSRAYAEKLLTLQDADGFFPAWLTTRTLEIFPELLQSPESAQSATFLLKLHRVTKDARYRQSALRSVEAIVEHIIPEGRWEDFETYWSCSSWGRDDFQGRKIPRNQQFKQNNLSIYWTAEALLEAWHTTHENRYLEWGQRCLDELLLYQAAWQPPYLYVEVFGGFGVMNADGEWNDSRQSLFAELILRYAEALQMNEYRERGMAALRAAFSMMYAPENAIGKALWEKRWPFFGPEDYGFMMENYGHGGIIDKDGTGMGDFTIFDWGNGAAAEAYNRILDHFGPEIFAPCQK